MYYNTTSETGDNLKESHKKTESQQQKVLNYFINNGESSPSKVASKLNLLITSVRRCITDLTTDGHLKKTTKKVIGMYGKPEYIWELHVSEEEGKHLEELGEAWANEQPWK